MQMIPARRAPTPTSGFAYWTKKNLFNGPFNTVMTLVAGAVAAWALFNLGMFIFVEASWAQVWNNMKLFGVYRYPTEYLWRPLLIVGLMLGLMGAMAGASGP